MITAEIKKPEGTFYTDFIFHNGHFYAIFEHDSRVSKIKGPKTEITNETWILRDDNGKIQGFNGQIVETDDSLIAILNK